MNVCECDAAGWFLKHNECRELLCSTTHWERTPFGERIESEWIKN